MKYFGRKSGMSRTNAIIMISNMYINKNMTVKEISEKTGYAENTVKRYLQLGGVKKRDVKNDKGIIELENNYVIYNGKLYKRVPKKELMDILKKDIGKNNYTNEE